MSERPNAAPASPLPGRLATAAAYLAFAGALGVTLLATTAPAQRLWYLALYGASLALFVLVFERPTLPQALQRGCMAAQSVLVLAILARDPQMGVVLALLPLLAYQAALIFHGPERWLWAGWLALLAVAPLMFWLGPLVGLARGLLPASGAILLAAYVAVREETEAARAVSARLLVELQAKGQALHAQAAQAAEIAALEERNRLARELHDSVSQTIFSLTLEARAAQLLLHQQDPAPVRPHLEHLQSLAHQALAQMRTVISQTRQP